MPGIFLPCLYSELKKPEVLDPIIDEINQTGYLHSIVVALGGADQEQIHEARNYFARLRTPNRQVSVIWIALGYILGKEEAEVIALHDCDIVTYDRLLLGRLIEPVANPNNDFEFCKGYYARISPTERAMKGRVTRLFVVPFVEAMMKIMRKRKLFELESFFRYHRSLNYPLAGEFSFTSYLARGLNIAYD